MLATLKQAVKRLPPIEAIMKRRYESYFKSAEGSGLCWGAFDSFSEARANCPASSRIGYDNDDCAAKYADRLERIFPYDYPVLFWLGPLLKSGSQVFDIGGHVGLHYYSYRKYLGGLAGVRWTVCEVPAAVERGRQLAAANNARDLHFTSNIEDVDGKDVVYSAGAIQYIEDVHLATLVSACTSPPRHLLLNKIPLHGGRDFVTLENIGPSFSPYQNYNREKFIDAFVALNYRLVDSWEVPGRKHVLPFHPELSYGFSSGMYFTRD